MSSKRGRKKGSKNKQKPVTNVECIHNEKINKIIQLNPDKIRRLTIISSNKMLLFDEMESINKIKIFNKYAQYPKISHFNNNFFNKKAKISLFN